MIKIFIAIAIFCTSFFSLSATDFIISWTNNNSNLYRVLCQYDNNIVVMQPITTNKFKISLSAGESAYLCVISYDERGLETGKSDTVFLKSKEEKQKMLKFNKINLIISENK